MGCTLPIKFAKTLAWFSGGESSALLAFCTSDSACLYSPIVSYALARRSSAFELSGTTASAAVHSLTASLCLLKQRKYNGEIECG